MVLCDVLMILLDVGMGFFFRYKLQTESKGHIVLHVDIILRNFCQFGIEYK